MKYEKSLVILKPSTIERRIVGDVLNRIERKGLDILAMKMCKPTKTQYAEHYKEHKGKVFYEKLMTYMQSGHVVAMVIGGVHAIGTCRQLAGATDPTKAAPGSIRGDFALSMPANIIHASDSVESASREIKIFFASSEVRKLSR